MRMAKDKLYVELDVNYKLPIFSPWKWICYFIIVTDNCESQRRMRDLRIRTIDILFLFSSVHLAYDNKTIWIKVGTENFTFSVTSFSTNKTNKHSKLTTL